MRKIISAMQVYAKLNTYDHAAGQREQILVTDGITV
jgi:hypothetical protein